jgi:hypothetical protein
MVFPLLCPVREKDWVVGWDPATVYSDSGFAEKDCVFVTGEGGEESVWVVTVHDRERYVIEMVKISPGTTVGRIDISLERAGEYGTNARVRYMYTALGPEGERFVQAYSEEYYREFMSYWEKALNEYLLTARDAGGSPIT